MLFDVNVVESWLHEEDLVMNSNHGHLPFLYSGLPIGGDPINLHLWYPLIAWLRSRLSRWKSRNLSLEGRPILLKSVLSFIPVHLFPSSRLLHVLYLLLNLFTMFFFGRVLDKIGYFMLEKVRKRVDFCCFAGLGGRLMCLKTSFFSTVYD